jgi:hypothetical protein
VAAAAIIAAIDHKAAASMFLFLLKCPRWSGVYGVWQRRLPTGSLKLAGMNGALLLVACAHLIKIKGS